MSSPSIPTDPAGSPAADAPRRGSNQEIMLVEDEQAFRFLLGEFLRRYGYIVHEAENGRAALQLLRERPVGLIITDICMPDFDGIELLRVLRNQPAAPALVVMSGGMTGGTLGGDPTLFLKIAESLGAAHTLSKPFPLDALLTVVRDLIGQAR
jgi:CheY-like chemotaxis protein